MKNPFGKQKILNPKTLGQHLLNKRLESGLLQREVAEILSVSEDTITDWENGRAQAQVKHYPAIISFLGYYPFSHETETYAGKLIQIRYCKGLSVKHCAWLLCISEDAARRWERGKPISNMIYQRLIHSVWMALPQHFLQHPS